MHHLFLISATVLCFVFQDACLPGRADAGNDKTAASQVQDSPSPNWVHPARRKDYPGYRRHEEQKQDAGIWQYSTNRPLGNIRGGGTTPVEAYRPFNSPRQIKRQ